MAQTETVPPHGFVSGNYFDKYGSRSQLHRALVRGFVRSARELVQLTAPTRVLDVGCGAGELAARLFGQPGAGSPVAYTGLDVSESQVAAAQARLPGCPIVLGTAYDLPFPDRSFDLVVVCEVLEHLDRPADGLGEAVRVSAGHVLVSVPWEPVWRASNLARGKYWHALGNTPGHVQHFSRRRIRSLVGSRLTVVAERRPFPWTMLLGRRGAR